MTRCRATRKPGFLAPAALAVLGTLFGGSAASAAPAPDKREPTEVRAAVGLPPTHPVVAEGWRAFADVATRDPNNGLKFRLFVNGALLGASGGIEPLAQGDADFGFVVPARYPEQFPYTVYLTELALAGDNGLAAAAAMTEQMLLGCDPCADEFLEQGLVFLGTYSAAPYVLISKHKIDTPASLKGRNVRTPGTIWDRWVAALGARPVHHSASAAGTQTQAVAAGASVDASIDVALSLARDTAGAAGMFVTRLGLGGYRGASPFTANRDFWNDLTAAQRRTFFDSAAAGIVAATHAYEAQARTVIEGAVEKGITLVAADPSLDSLVRTIAVQDGDRAAGVARDREGIVDADDILAQYRALYEKYVGLFRNELRPEERTRILSREIYAKLDAATYAAVPSTDEAEAKKK